jgi:hypothetical protein
MILLEKIDAVLGCLYEHSGENPDIDLILKWLQDSEIDLGEIQDCLLHLHKEGYIYCELLRDRNHSYTDVPGAHYLISFKGKFFWETVGGYQEQHKKEQITNAALEAQNQRMERNEARLVGWTRNLFWGTIAVAVGAIGLVIWEMWHYYKTSH